MRQFAPRIWNALPIAWRLSPVGRFLVECYRLSFRNWFGLGSLCTELAQMLRLRLLAAGLPLRRQFLVLRCREGSHAIGFFSELATVLGALAHYEHWARPYAGLRVDFAMQGLYYDAAFGANWWEYHFEPIELGSAEGAVTSVASPLWRNLFAFRGERISRKRGYEIIDRYIRPRPHIRDKVEAFVQEHFQNAFVVGIHYRGTDKYVDAPAVPYERVRAAVLNAIIDLKPGGYRLFLATDEQAFFDYMLAEFPGVLTHRRMYRSVDGRPISMVNEDGNYKKGEDAVIDCLLLSRCNCLIRTASNLSWCSMLFNPDLPEIALNRER